LEGAANEWRVGERDAWIGLAVESLILLRASELFPEDDGSVHAV